MLLWSEGIELPDGERMKVVDQEGYKHHWALQLHQVMDKEEKESIANEYIRRVKLICKSNRNSENFNRIINWTRDELQNTVN